MKQGIDWSGNYSRAGGSSFDETKGYVELLKEQGTVPLDDEFNMPQEMLLTFLRHFVWDSFGNGSAQDSFLVVGTSADNDFTISGAFSGSGNGPGRMWVNGYCVELSADTTFSGQAGQGSVGGNLSSEWPEFLGTTIKLPGEDLTTPTANRTDEVFLDIYLDEVGPTQDPGIVDPTLGVETSRRLKLYWAVCVAEGDVTPGTYTDPVNRDHFTCRIAILNRTAQAAIDADMVQDKRTDFTKLWAKVNGDSTKTFAVASATTDSQAINLGQADGLYAQLAAANVFTALQTAPDFKATDNSDPARKQDLQPYTLDWATLRRIRAWAWQWKGAGEDGSGALATEAAEVVPEHVHFDVHGRPTGVQYGPLAFLIARRCMDEIDTLRDEIASLREEVGALRSQQ